mgnify:CR=1 FL=1
MKRDGRVNGPSDNYSRDTSSSTNTIYSHTTDIHHFKIDKEDGKHKDAKVEITSTETSEITQKKENRKETRKED